VGTSVWIGKHLSVTLPILLQDAVRSPRAVMWCSSVRTYSSYCRAWPRMSAI
jgi:hypothetical protein